MPNIDIYGKIVSFPDDLSEEDLRKAVESSASQMETKPPFYQRAADKINKIVETVSPILSPLQQWAGKAQNIYERGFPQAKFARILTEKGLGAFEKGGELAATGLASKGVNPLFSAGVGTAIQMAPYVPVGAGPLKTGIPKIFAERPIEAPMNVLQKIGSRGIAETAGLTPKTVGRITGEVNPARAGYELAETMRREGLTARTAEEMWDQAKGLENRYGQKVGKAINDIKSTGIPTEVSDDVLEPLYRKVKEMTESPYSENRIAVRPFKQAYESLRKLANENQGNLTLDDIRKELDQIGSLMEKVGESKLGNYKSLYGTVADIRDSIVQRIADLSNDPSLRESLLTANKDYSRVMRLIPDIKKEALREGIKRPTRFSISEAAYSTSLPYVSRFAGKVGRQFAGGVNATLGTLPLAGTAIIQPQAEQKQLDETKARELLKQAEEKAKSEGKGGMIEYIKDLARQNARELGFTW